MSSPTDNFRINLNQNLWGVIVSFGFLGAAEYYSLCVLFWFSLIPAIAMTISVCFTTYSYTKKYISNKGTAN